MICSETNIRIRYSETDKMGYLHHANYLNYFEIGRTEILRNMGMTYREMEEDGMPGGNPSRKNPQVRSARSPAPWYQSFSQ